MSLALRFGTVRRGGHSLLREKRDRVRHWAEERGLTAEFARLASRTLDHCHERAIVCPLVLGMLAADGAHSAAREEEPAAGGVGGVTYDAVSVGVPVADRERASELEREVPR